MNGLLVRLPLALTLFAVLALLVHGPIAQLAHYHEFADQRVVAGLPNGADVLSNLGFAALALWGLLGLWPARRHPAIAAGWPGYCLFLVALLLTAVGSSFYHLAPDNDRLIWDRLPIALACAGLLAAVCAEMQPKVNGRRWAAMLAVAATASVVWWYVTERSGHGDLRPYLLLQGLPLLLIPLWQAIYRAPRRDRLAFSAAIVLYLMAKVAELHDHELLATLGWMSGHTLKHLLATAGAAVLIARLVGRVGNAVELKKNVSGHPMDVSIKTR
jgi:hypothetical protein